MSNVELRPEYSVSNAVAFIPFIQYNDMKLVGGSV